METSAITINKKEIMPKEYNGQRVVTFKDIDTVHDRPAGTARRNFNANKKHLVDGIDYYKISPNEFRTTIGEMDSRQSNCVSLITESGYLMLVKSFTDDLAWEVQRSLVENYFHCKNEAIPEEYSFIPKSYKGTPVITVLDMLWFLRDFCIVTKGKIEHQLLHSKVLRKDQDYYFLKGENLAEFKLENPQISRQSASIYLITQSGFLKFIKFFGVKFATPECLKQKNQEPQLQIEAPKLPVKVDAPKEEMRGFIQVPDCISFQQAFRDIRRKIIGLEVLLDSMDRYNSTSRTLMQRAQVAIDLSVEIEEATIKLCDIEPEVITSTWFEE